MDLLSIELNLKKGYIKFQPNLKKFAHNQKIKYVVNTLRPSKQSIKFFRLNINILQWFYQ